MQRVALRLRILGVLAVLGGLLSCPWSTRAAPTAVPPSSPLPLAASPAPAAASTLAPNGEVLPGMKEWRGKRNPVPWDGFAAAKAFVLYREHCAPCHGTAGRGDGPVVATFSAGQRRPLDFSTGRFAYGAADWQVMRSIWRGVPGTMMAAWQAAGRDPREAWILVHYVKRRCVIESPHPAWENEPPPPGTR